MNFSILFLATLAIVVGLSDAWYCGRNLKYKGTELEFRTFKNIAEMDKADDREIRSKHFSFFSFIYESMWRYIF